MMSFRMSAATLSLLALAACAKETQKAEEPADASYQDQLQTALLDAKPGDVIEIPEGRFSFDRSLSLTVNGVTIKGAGMDKTVLSFKGQVAGAEGLLVTANDFTVEDLAIEDTKGDGIKVNEGENIVFRRVRVEWTGGPKTENGAYGLYPVQTKNVLIEESHVIGAADAGIYVGQSQNVVVRNNKAERNVAGIEIENTFDADVYDNVATENTGGILVFNMPNLKQPGARTRVFKNKVYDNNTKNFGLPGTAVSNIPAGSGVVINSNDYVEIFDNDITGNKTANVIIASVFSSGLSQEGMTGDFDPYPEAIYVHDNRMSDGGKNPDGLDFQALKVAMFGPLGALPDVIVDGYVDPAKLVDGAVPEELRICVQNGEAEVLDVDGPNDNAKPRLATAEHDCALAPLAPVVLANGLGE
ncbi:MAG TPA: parallel beta-helix domain-containing protein [Parvularculaceae bacterium]|nr:parallel beta-helix domain-containing protein [Parvularculaceae bacterium]HRX40246.1 parallel beta-helix domain-containing protein [Parvularculaceae bacterium]